MNIGNNSIHKAVVSFCFMFIVFSGCKPSDKKLSDSKEKASEIVVTDKGNAVIQQPDEDEFLQQADTEPVRELPDDAVVEKTVKLARERYVIINEKLNK